MNSQTIVNFVVMLKCFKFCSLLTDVSVFAVTSFEIHKSLFQRFKYICALEWIYYLFIGQTKSGSKELQWMTVLSAKSLNAWTQQRATFALILALQFMKRCFLENQKPFFLETEFFSSIFFRIRKSLLYSRKKSTHGEKNTFVEFV